jgi:hypothetical protein
MGVVEERIHDVRQKFNGGKGRGEVSGRWRGAALVKETVGLGC